MSRRSRCTSTRGSSGAWTTAASTRSSRRSPAARGSPASTSSCWTRTTRSPRASSCPTRGAPALARHCSGGRVDRSGLYEPATNRVARQLDAVAHAELLEDVAAVVLDGLLRDHQRRGDLVARVTLGDELDDLELARSERVGGRGLAALGAAEVVADQRGDGRRVEERLAPHRRTARLDEVAVRRALEHIARRSRLERLEEVLLAVVHREHQRPQLGPTALELGGGLQAGEARHRDVRYGEVHLGGERQAHRLAAVAGLGDHREVGFGVEHHAQAAADHRVVVGEQDARGQRDAHAMPSGNGMSRRTSVPPAGTGETVSLPPTCSARSCMPAIPLPTFAPDASPRPSSRTTRRRPPPTWRRATSTSVACAWRMTLVRLS